MKYYTVNTNLSSMMAYDYAVDIVQGLNMSGLDGYYDLGENVWEYLDRDMVYYDNQWKVMMEYQLPQDANFNEAYMSLYDDVIECIQENDMMDDIKIEYDDDEGIITVRDYKGSILYEDPYFVSQYDDERNEMDSDVFKAYAEDQFKEYLNDEAGEETARIIVKELIK